MPHTMQNDAATLPCVNTSPSSCNVLSYRMQLPALMHRQQRGAAEQRRAEVDHPPKSRQARKGGDPELLDAARYCPRFYRVHSHKIRTARQLRLASVRPACPCTLACSGHVDRKGVQPPQPVRSRFLACTPQRTVICAHTKSAADLWLRWLRATFVARKLWCNAPCI
jgi:hypothetical protein